MSNDSDIVLQAVDSNINLSTDTETSTINLADLCSGNNPEIWQRILLVQDESGNIETVFLLQDDAEVIEGASSIELDNQVLPLSESNNIENTQADQCIIVDNISMNNTSAEIQNVLLTQGVPANAQNVLKQNFSGNDENVSKSEEARLQINTLMSQNLNADNDLKTEIFSDAPKAKSTEYSENNEAVSVKEETKNDIIMTKTTVTATKDSCDKYQILSVKQSLDNSKNIQECLTKSAKKSIGSSTSKECVGNIKLNQNSNAISTNLNDNSEISESITLTSAPLCSKAKKSFPCAIPNSEKSRELIQYSQSPLSTVVSSSNTYKTSILTPVNGAVYHSESDHSAANKTYNSTNLSSSEHLTRTELLLNKSLQKSKKTFSHKLNRSAKKSISRLGVNNSSLNISKPSISQACDILNLSNSNSVLSHIRNDENYLKLKSMILKRRIEDENLIHSIQKRTKNFHLKDICNNEISDNFNGVLKSKNRSIALKTFKRPFTAAKKSVFDSREIPRNVRNTAVKTFLSKTKINSALKSFSHKQVMEPKQVISTGNLLLRATHENNASMAQNNKYNPESNIYFQPEVCEIRILPNDYIKRASHLLLKAKHATIEPASTPEETVSDEEMKLSSICSSPIKELMLFKFCCSCTAKEVPCLCNDNNLQLICEAEDSFDEKIIPCTNNVSQQYLLTPSSEIKHRAFCDIHLWRLRHHHCCPKCGIFCSQGEFLLCSNDELEKKENHLFHTSCFIVPSPGFPPGCPHCCRFSHFNSVYLTHRSCTDQELKEVPSNAQNLTSELDSCDIFLTVKQDASSGDKIDSEVFIPEKSDVQLMIAALAKEKTLRLRPTGKCLYNPIKIGDVQKVMQLIGNGVNPNHKFRMHGNNAPLHVAAHYGWTGILHILLQAGAFIDSVNDDLETPLIVAAEKNQLPIVRYLVLAGAQIDVKDCNGMTSFHIASKNGFKEIAEFLYSTGRIDINLQDDGGWTALVWACEHKHVNFVKWLLEIGADPNVRDNEENTVLHWAAYSGKYEIAQLLLDKGCTLSYVNKRGDSALHIAAREDNYECVKLFINRGAVVDQKNKENKTPLMCCQDDSISFNYLCQSISSGALKIGKMQLEKHVVFRDISRGAEAYPIQAINEVDDEEFIMEFRYVVKQCHRSGVNINSIVDSMQFCYCKDNCVTRDCNCTMNSKCWYDVNGCLTSEYDLQSLPAIFECNKTCHCPKTCINRVVQQGLKFPLQIFRTRYQGWGVRTLQDIPKGAFVCEYVGELITGTEATQRDDDTYFFDLESQGSDYCLDGRYYGNVARFLNHSCEPNLVALKVFVDHQDLNFPRIAFFAFRKIQAFEELCFDYGLDFWLVKCQSLLCTCNSQSCKYSKDTIDDTLWKFFMDTKDGAQLDSGS